MKRTYLLGVVAASVIAACSSSKDSVLNSGTGGNGHGGAAGTASGGTGGTASGGTGQGGAAVPCDGGAVIICTDGTKVCSLTACPPTGGTGGGAGRGGDGGAGTTGSAGTTGAAGRGGSGGTAGTTGAAGARGGSGGTSGSAGAGGGVGGTTGGGGTGGRACETAECARPYLCRSSCGGPVVSNNCCACEPPLFDDFNGQVCGDGGTGSVTYVGCRFIGGINRVVVAKRDTARNLCFNLALTESTAQPPPGLTLPALYVIESATVGPASVCPTRTPQPTPAGPITGSVSLVPNGGDAWGAADVDVMMTFGSNDAGAPPGEQLSAHGVSLLTPCL